MLGRSSDDKIRFAVPFDILISCRERPASMHRGAAPCDHQRIEGRKIFRSGFDRMNFLNRLSELVPETKTECFAWAILPNRFHLSLRTDTVPISLFMNFL